MRVVYNEAYKQLFTDAETLLANSGITSNSGGKIVIEDLASYYHWLDKLEQIGGPSFLRRLPLDEDIFYIDTSSRTITPYFDEDDAGRKLSHLANAKWVIGVKDDHLAEILWFHVDRFFDGQDLAICFPQEGDTLHQGQTYIQWKNSKGQGLDPVQHVQINEKEIWFGWYLRSNDGVLNSSGDLVFSVRFQYHKGGTETGPDLTSEVLFSLNTLTYTCTILPNLIETMGSNIHNISDLNVENIATQGMIRPRFSGIFNNTDGPKAYIDGELSEDGYVDLDENGEAVLTITADGSGTLLYRWYKDGALIEGENTNTCTVNSIGTYTVQVGNAYDKDDPTKVRWTDSDPCEVPEASELVFAEGGNIRDHGYADGRTELSVNVVRANDDFGRNDKGVITYTWYRDALEGEYFDNNPENKTQIVATTEKYTPTDGEVGYYYVKAINTHNGDSSKECESQKCTMKVPAQKPSNVVIVFNEITKKLTAEVTIDHKNDLYYEWHDIAGKFNEGPTLGKNSIEVKHPGTYYCRVYQHVYPGEPTLESASEKTGSEFVDITEAMLK